MTSSTLSQAEVTTAHTEGAEADRIFKETLAEVTSRIASVDPLEILARAGLSLLFAGREVDNAPGKNNVQIYQIELIQALALSNAQLSKAADIDYPAVTEELVSLLAKNIRAYRDKAKLKITQNIDVNQRQNMIARIQEWTLIIRGARHGFQTREFVSEIAQSINPAFRSSFGCDATAFINVITQFVETTKRRVQNHLAGIHSWSNKSTGIAMIEAFVAGIPEEEGARIRAEMMPWRYDRKRVRLHFWALSLRRVRELFTFRLSECLAAFPADQRPALGKIMAGLMHSFGDITPQQLQYLHLDNPVQRRPFIRIDEDRFFCAAPQLVTIHFAEIFESICAGHPKLKIAAEDARSDWLEDRLHKIVVRYFPDAEVHQNIEWGDGLSSKNWETDTLAIIDKTLIIFEAKSAKIKPSARRGSTQSLTEALKELVVKPSEQSRRLKQLIQSASGPLTLRSSTGPFTIDPTQIREVIRVNVLQDAVGPLSAHWPQLKETGLIPKDADIAPSMSIFELETVLDVLTLQLERCHYLARRTELERNALYEADEFDLLSVYLETQFNIGESEFNGELLQWYGKSLRIMPTYDDEGVKQTAHIGMQRTEFWKRLLQTLESRQAPGWTRFGHRLLNLPQGGQRKVELSLDAGIKRVTREQGEFFVRSVEYGSRFRAERIAMVASTARTQEEFEAQLPRVAASVLGPSKQDDMLVIFRSVVDTRQPYDFIGVIKRQPRSKPLPRFFS